MPKLPLTIRIYLGQQRTSSGTKTTSLVRKTSFVRLAQKGEDEDIQQEVINIGVDYQRFQGYSPSDNIERVKTTLASFQNRHHELKLNGRVKVYFMGHGDTEDERWSLNSEVTYKTEEVTKILQAIIDTFGRTADFKLIVILFSCFSASASAAGALENTKLYNMTESIIQANYQFPIWISAYLSVATMRGGTVEETALGHNFSFAPQVHITNCKDLNPIFSWQMYTSFDKSGFAEPWQTGLDICNVYTSVIRVTVLVLISMCFGHINTFLENYHENALDFVTANYVFLLAKFVTQELPLVLKPESSFLIPDQILSQVPCGGGSGKNLEEQIKTTIQSFFIQEGRLMQIWGRFAGRPTTPQKQIERIPELVRATTPQPEGYPNSSFTAPQIPPPSWSAQATPQRTPQRTPQQRSLDSLPPGSQHSEIADPRQDPRSKRRPTLAPSATFTANSSLVNKILTDKNDLNRMINICNITEATELFAGMTVSARQIIERLDTNDSDPLTAPNPQFDLAVGPPYWASYNDYWQMQSSACCATEKYYQGYQNIENRYHYVPFTELNPARNSDNHYRLKLHFWYHNVRAEYLVSRREAKIKNLDRLRRCLTQFDQDFFILQSWCRLNYNPPY